VTELDSNEETTEVVGDPEHNFLIVSDTHLSEGFLPRIGRWAPNEDFTSDVAFAQFLRFHDEHRQKGRPWRLIIAGDVFDFLQVVARPAADVTELKLGITQLRGGVTSLNHMVAEPQRRIAEIDDWLDQIVKRIGPNPSPAFQSLMNSAEELRAISSRIRPELVWDLERLAIEASVLALKRKAKLTSSNLTYGLGTSEPETVWKLDRIAEGHTIFFGALAWFLDQGNEVVMMKGNHDVELHWPEVQARIRNALADAHADMRLAEPRWAAKPSNLALGSAAFRTRIETALSFCPWIYFEPELLYVEHGSQYGAIDGFDDFLDPVLRDDRSFIRLPPGSFAVRFFINKAEQTIPFIDNLRPITRALVWALNNRLTKVMEVLLRHWKGLVKFQLALLARGPSDLGRDIVSRFHRKRFRRDPDRGDREKLERIRKADYALGQGLRNTVRDPLTYHHLQRIEDYAKQVRKSAVQRIRRTVQIWIPISIPIFIGIVLLVILGLPIWWAGGLEELIDSLGGNLWIRLAAAIIFGVGVKRILAPRIFAAGETRDHLTGAALDVWRILQKPVGSKKAPVVRYLVFGHTHDPNMCRLEKSLDAPWYVNTGSWLSTVNEVESWDRLELDFTYLQIIPDETPRVPGLYRWNQAARKPERIRRRLSERDSRDGLCREAKQAPLDKRGS
jgi:UDP-2,3-diacylglucosamine pyrophosphatase LpxH